jgi:hypothetical protein
MKRPLAVAALAVAITASLATAARAERPRVAVMQLDSPKVTADLRERMTHAVHEGLLAAGADVVDGMPAAATGPGGAPCQGPGCVTAVARATVAGYVLRGTLDVEGRTYGLRLEMLDGKTGALLDSREDRCEICTEGEALEMAGVSASALKVQVFKKRAATPVATAAAPAPGASSAELRLQPTPAQPQLHDTGHRKYGWAAIGVGTAAIVAGLWLVAKNNDGTCDDGPNQCPKVYKTSVPGFITVGVGGLVVAAGALLFTGQF